MSACHRVVSWIQPLGPALHHPATPVYRLESPVRRTPRGRTIRELLCGLVCYLYIEPCVACVIIRRIHTAGINIYYICILDLFVPPLCIVTSLSPTGCCIVKSAPRYCDSRLSILYVSQTVSALLQLRVS